MKSPLLRLGRLALLLAAFSFFNSAARAIDDPVSPNAIPEAKSLLNYLNSISGTKILAGQQESTSVPVWGGNDNVEFNYLQTNVGKLPVVRGFDFIWYMYSTDIAKGQTVGSRGIQWANQGGVVQLCCHWFTDIGSPVGNPQFYLPGAGSGPGTTFDITQVVIDGTPENKEFLEKIGRIAPDLKLLQDAHIPVIWRPFHECTGNWFWWSAKGPAAFKAAYRLLFDQLTNHYGLTNLIWCYNPTEATNGLENWYPGDDVVDIISLDTYPSSGHPSFAADYRHFRDFRSGRKVVTMSENGAIPDPNTLFSEGAGWASFCTWNGSFITGTSPNSLDYIKSVYNHPNVITLDEVPDVYHWVAGLPSVVLNPASTTASTGANVTLSVLSSGATSFQWKKDGADIPGATSANFNIPTVTASNAGTYTAVITNAAGSLTSKPAALTVTSDTFTAPSNALINLSTRAYVGTGGDQMIAGFVIRGSGAKKLLIRAIGPSLAQYNVSGVLADPTMTLVNSDGVTLATNDDWTSTDAAGMANAFAQAGAWALPSSSLDSALVVTLPVGAYTVLIQGKNNGTGVALVELYDMDTASAARLINISTRAQVRTGAEVMIAGFVVNGTGNKKLVARAVGPTLATAPYNVTGVLANPALTLNDTHNILATNDDWSADSTQASVLTAAFTSAGAFALPTGSKDAAIIIDRSPGAYTLIINGADTTPGVALVEVYESP